MPPPPAAGCPVARVTGEGFARAQTHGTYTSSVAAAGRGRGGRRVLQWRAAHSPLHAPRHPHPQVYCTYWVDRGGLLTSFHERSKIRILRTGVKRPQASGPSQKLTQNELPPKKASIFYHTEIAAGPGRVPESFDFKKKHIFRLKKVQLVSPKRSKTQRFPMPES